VEEGLNPGYLPGENPECGLPGETPARAGERDACLKSNPPGWK